MKCRVGMAVVVAGGALASCLPDPGFAQAPPVNHLVAVARPPHYQGPCPMRFEFIGTIFVNYPTVVTYRWERSDHAMGSVQSVRINGAG
jgi:hypothetical protein